MSKEAHAPNLADAALSESLALPNGANTTNSDPIDLEVVGDLTTFLAGCELKVTAPALTTAQLPDAQTITYEIEHDDDDQFGTAETLVAALIVQTGAGGAGDAEAVGRFRFPSTVKRYVRVNAVKTGAADASGASASIQLVF